MALQSLARPLENVDSLDEARVLAIVDHLAPLLDSWREGQDLRLALDEARQSLAEKQAGFDTNRSAFQHNGELIRRAQEPAARLGLGAIGAIIAGIVGVLLPFESLRAWIALPLFAGALVLGFFWLRARQQIEDLTRRRTALEKSAAELDAEITGLKTREGTIQDELAQRSDSFPTLELADVRFPLKLVDMAGRYVLLDQSGSYDDVTLRAVDATGLESGVAGIAERIDGLLNVPPMLSSSTASDSEDPLERLYGEENELSNLVTDFSRSLGLLRNVELSLPIVPVGGVLTQRIASDAGQTPLATAPVVVTRDADDAAQIGAFVEEVEASRGHGQRVFAELEDAHARLSAGCSLYASARQASVNTLHRSWLEVLERANWCDRRFYCARTIMSPKYLEDLLGCPVDQAYRLSADDLVDVLRNDESIRRRMEIEPELETQLRSAHIGVQELMTPGDSSDGVRITRPRHIEDQYRECLLMFQRTLQKVMTGSSFPLLNISSEAILHYDPETEEWSSELSPHVYRTHEVLRYGSIVKAYSDLMIPLWEHLWTEKADFRKAETFRTNDQLIRMSEKEAEKLIDVANQFRDDLRSVREHVNILGADLKSKLVEITSFKEGMDDLGILSDRARVMIEHSGHSMGEQEATILAQADRYETILATQPQQQMENRGTVQDPIELVRGFEALIVVDRAPHLRLLPA